MASENIEELPDVRVEVTDVVFMPALECPPDKPFPFVYFITVRNQSPRTVTLRARKWVVREADGETVVVQGDGVVGQTPRLEPGEIFSYNSYHTIARDSEASGALFGESDDGSLFFTRIPPFRMEVPGT
ncbi:MAG: ApaG domain [Verrucomicrobiales bacterium]